jgi:hypothetical protein
VVRGGRDASVGTAREFAGSDDVAVEAAAAGLLAFVVPHRGERIAALLAASQTKKSVVPETVTSLDDRRCPRALKAEWERQRDWTR